MVGRVFQGFFNKLCEQHIIIYLAIVSNGIGAIAAKYLSTPHVPTIAASPTQLSAVTLEKVVITGVTASVKTVHRLFQNITELDNVLQTPWVKLNRIFIKTSSYIY